MTVYIRHQKTGSVQSVADEHFYKKSADGRDIDSNISVVVEGERYPRPGIEVISEKEARAKHPQLFGKADPQIVFTPAELVAQATYQKQLAEFRQFESANFAAAHPEE